MVQEYVGLTGKGRVFTPRRSSGRGRGCAASRGRDARQSFIIYNEFLSVLQQRVVVEQTPAVAVMMKSGAGRGRTTGRDIEYIYEHATPKSSGRCCRA